MTVYEMMVKQRKDQTQQRKVYPERGEPWRLANERLGLNGRRLDITEIDIGGEE